MKTNDMSKLPKWAQTRISTLEENVKYHQRRLAETIGKKPSKIEIGPVHRAMDGGAPRIFIPSEETVRYLQERCFSRSPGNSYDPYIEIRRQKDGTLHVYGNEEIVVQPQSSNVLHVRIGSLR